MLIEKTLSNGNTRIGHIVVYPSGSSTSFREQADEVMVEFENYRKGNESVIKPVFVRIFLSDPHNQRDYLTMPEGCAVSIVGQAPVGAKIALWGWFMDAKTRVSAEDGKTKCLLNGMTHVFEVNNRRNGMDSYDATYDILLSSAGNLEDEGGSLLKNCVRTWFFVRDIDNNYQGVVDGRNRLFGEKGLTKETRFIASTGIGGCTENSKEIVSEDSYSILGLPADAMRQINAPDYLNPTHEYGVAFERATSVTLPNLRLLFISGTASIGNRGEVLFEGDIVGQTDRMLTNIRQLLKSAGMTAADLMQGIVYLRDPDDYAVVSEIIHRELPRLPVVIVHAPVCRPEWLIEMEGIAARVEEP